MGGNLVTIIKKEDGRFLVEGDSKVTVDKSGTVQWGNKFVFPREAVVGFVIDQTTMPMHLLFRSKKPDSQERDLDLGLIQNYQQIKTYVDEINSKYA
jgi:hypothetical protein